MMGRRSGQMSMVILDIAELIPSDHLLRKSNQMVSFDVIYVILQRHITLQMVIHLLTLLVCVKCCWLDTFMTSSQNADLSRKFS